MLGSTPDITLIFPAYNEVEQIKTCLDQAVTYLSKRNLGYQIIVSADGTDGTREAAAEFRRGDGRIDVIGDQNRRGKGKGIREAVKLAAGHIVGFADADNKVPIDELDKVLAELQLGFDIVIGSRALASSVVERPQPLYRQIGSKAFAVLMHAVVGLRGVHDTQCGFKFFRQHVIKDVFGRQSIDGYMFDVEILSIAQRLGYSVKEIPVRWRDDADSRLQLLSGNFRNAVDLLKIRRSTKSAVKMDEKRKIGINSAAGGR